LNRPIRSYVLRQGRTTPAQQRALEQLLPRYGLAFSPEPILFQQVFHRRAPLVLEIGSGMGETTAAIARARPDADFIAVEVHGPGVGSLLNRISKDELSNLRVIRHDAVEVLERMITDASLAAIHLFFPDPWPKKRHHKRRLVQPPFLAALARVTAPGARLYLATDWAPYAQQMLEVCTAARWFDNLAPGEAWSERPGARPPTKFERRGLRLGHAVFDLAFRRNTVRAAASG
jgi:tRNA (guanine-N7-)-methyltransferase